MIRYPPNRVNSKPPIRSYLHHAYQGSIISAYNEYLPWLHSHYIQLISLANGALDFYIPLLFHADNPVIYNSPFLKVLGTDLNVVLSCGGIIKFLKGNINNNNYVTFGVDEYYLPERNSYRKFHNGHNLLVFGYDELAQTIESIGYNDRGEYAITKYSYTEICNAVDPRQSGSTVVSVKYLPNSNPTKEKTYPFNYSLVVETLEDYLQSRSSSNKLHLILNHSTFSNTEKYGLEACWALIDLLYRHESIDIVPFYLFWEHKKCMLHRLKYMEDRHYLNPKYRLQNAYRKIEKSAAMLKLVALKYSIYDERRNNSNMGKIKYRLEKIIHSEAEILDKVLNAITAHTSQIDPKKTTP